MQVKEHTSLHGLSSIEAKNLLEQTGRNEIPKKNTSVFIKLLRKLFSPISFMLLAAALLSLFVGKVFDFYFILTLLILNVLIALWQENKADDAIKKLNKHLSEKIKTFRDEKWEEIDASNLVKGDLIQLESGEVIPADGKILEAKHVSINESALTGESLPKDKKENDLVYSGSFLTTGVVIIRITATGKNTSFGKTVFSVETLRKKSLLEKDILDISKFLTVLSLIAVIILSIIFLLQKGSYLELLTLDLSLLIAGIPISLPTVMTLIIEFGVIALAKKNAIVRRLSALEDLANVNYLLTDKTGTLTKNKITVQDIYAYGKFTHSEVILYSYLATAKSDHNVIDIAIANKAKEMQIATDAYKIIDFIPADSARKRSTTSIQHNGKEFILSLGAPQIVELYCTFTKGKKEKFEREVESLAKNGYRSLAIAIRDKKTKENKMELVGLIALSDVLREDARSVVQFLKSNGIGVSMVTGDNRAIAAQIAKELALDDGDVITKDTLDHINWSDIHMDFYTQAGAFAEILPEDKLKLVQKAKEFFIVAANGDGVNDLPAIKAANVGIAVKNAVSALKATADIVLLTNGISVIRDAIIESRKIFARLYTYSLYRISESLRMIVTIVILGALYRVYPLTPLQIIVVALLNDIPIISLAFDNVVIATSPRKINAKRRFTLSSLYGLVGIANSLLMFFIIRNLLHLDWGTIQTMYFLKMTVSGHMLIYVAHTKQRWWKFFPSKEVILSTTVTQFIATFLALTGFLMPAKISLPAVLFIWAWSFFWMQIGELVKIVQQKVK